MKKRYSKSRVYKSGNTYRYVITYSPDPYKKSIRIEKYGFKTEEEAKEAMMLKEAEFKAEKKITNKKYRIGNLVANYLDAKKSMTKPTSLHGTYLYLNKYLCIKYKNCLISDFCKMSNLHEYKEELGNSSNINSQSKNKIITQVKLCFEYGFRIGLVKIDEINRLNTVLTHFQVTEISSVKDKNYWSFEQYKNFIGTIENHWKVFFMVLGETGMRLGEIRGLQMKHFDPIKKTITIEQQAVDGTGLNKTLILKPKTLSSNRTIQLSNSLASTIELYIRVKRIKNPENFLFFGGTSSVGKTTVRRALNLYIEKAGLPHITPHGFRHSCSTWLLSQDLTPQEIGQVSRRLGHSSVKMTLDIYMHIHNQESSKITNFFEDND